MKMVLIAAVACLMMACMNTRQNLNSGTVSPFGAQIAFSSKNVKSESFPNAKVYGFVSEDDAKSIRKFVIEVGLEPAQVRVLEGAFAPLTIAARIQFSDGRTIMITRQKRDLDNRYWAIIAEGVTVH